MQVRRGPAWVPVDARLVKARHGLLAFPSAGTSSSRGHELKAKLTTSADSESTVDVNPSGTTQVDIAAIPSGDPTNCSASTPSPELKGNRAPA